MIQRIEKVRQIIKNQNLDALFVTDQYNVTYLTQFATLASEAREGFLFITSINAFLLTFPTYFGLYKDGGFGFNVLNITINKRLHHHLNEIITREKIKIIGVEKESLTLAEFESLTKKLKVKFHQTEGVVEKLRLIKSEQEISLIRKAAKVGDKAFEFIRKIIKVGVSEKTLAVELEYFIKKRAGNIAFSPIVAFNQNAAIPHYLPSRTCYLKPNSLILLDFGAKVNGYCSDMTRVIFFGKPTSNQVKAYHAVLETQQTALKKLKAGIKCAAADKLAKKFLTDKGYLEFPHGLGHGVGLAVHEAPRLKTDSRETLDCNMVVTVEPGIYFPKDYGIRIEDLVVLKKDGVEVLTKAPKELLIINK